MTLPPRSEWRRLSQYWLRDPLVGARLLAGHHGLRVLPTEAASAIGGRLGQLAGPRLHPSADRRARAALKALRPDLVPDQAALDAALKRVWTSVGRVYAEFSAEDRIWPEQRVTVEGAEHLEAAAVGGRPLIVAGVHLGNWEMLPITFGYLGYRFVQVYQPPRNRFEDRIAKNTRLRANASIGAAKPGSGFRLLPPSATAGPELLRALRRGDSFMIFVDEYAGGRVHAPAFGRPIAANGNLARVIRLARLGNAAVVPAYAVRTGAARFAVRFLPAVAMQATGDRGGDMRANMTALDAAITPAVLAHLDQWYMLIDFRMDR